MSDPETRIQVLEVFKDKCCLKTVLRLEKPCPYFGPSNTCNDCSFDWVTVVDEVLKVAKARRASYELEREKLAKLKQEHAALSESDSRNRELLSRIANGISAVVELVGIDIAAREQEREKKDVSRAAEDEAEKGVQGGLDDPAHINDGVRAG